MDDFLDARTFFVLMAARKLGNYLYAWGGESATEGGFDCSGFVSLCLMETARAWPGIYTRGRSTAAGLYSYYKKCPDITKEPDLKPGCLIFYRHPGKRISHVAIHAVTVPNIRLTEYGKGKTVPVGPVAFEAGGSGSKAISPRAALLDSAGVRMTASTFSGGREWLAKDPFILLAKSHGISETKNS